MDSRQFDKQFEIAGVSLIPKMKSCGKAYCGKCPHGPFWYAIAPGYWLAKRQTSRMEVYLGRSWNAENLLKEVAPRLASTLRFRFEGAIRVMLDRERLAKVGEELKGVAHERVVEGDVRARAERVYGDALKRLRKEESALKVEGAALTKKLKGARANGK